MKKTDSRCNRCVDASISCSFCGCCLVKNGKTKGKIQRYKCKVCKTSKVADIKQVNYGSKFDKRIVVLLKESCGIRSIGRILKISPTTVIRRILLIAKAIKAPLNLLKGRHYQVDELHTYVGNKNRRICVIYSWDAKDKRALTLEVGTRTKVNLRKVIVPLLLAEPSSINTDKYPGYLGLIPIKTHTTKKRKNNHIERENLNLRTSLKRLSRRTICFSKSVITLFAVVKIYFWL